MDRVGMKLFGSKWNGKEPEGRPDYITIPATWDEASDYRRAEVASRVPRTRGFRLGARRSFRAGDPVPEVTPEEWAAVVEARDEHRRLATESHGRFQAVLDAMTLPLRRGEIATWTRGKSEHQTSFVFMDAARLNLDNMTALFRYLTIVRQYGNASSEEWIFFDLPSFETFLAKIQPLSADVPSRAKSGPKKKDDDEAVAAMLVLMNADEKLSATAASRLVAAQLEGKQSVTAASRRIYERFRECHPARVRAYYRG